ncbi:phage terminase large subunit-like protein [Mumia flava]|uniref:Phage terminase large subunit-like protein n=1 Tax=Mumia flava TaxID=1348852 RepID=A0A0B2BSQ3_9ACTN|nr:hypothetical protein [Mumia flava]PJJ48305.1 phage terminase large subunit-like protein [Mumia flava]
MSWSGRKVAEARAYVARTALPGPCGRCGKPLTAKDRWVVGHIEPRWKRPDLEWTPSNWQVECRPCSDASAQAEVIAKAKHEALVEAGIAVDTDSFSPSETAGQPPHLPVHTHGALARPVEARDGLSWPELVQGAPEWLLPYLDLPEDASAPLWVSSVHPEAVGSYGPEAIAWMESNLTERGRPLRFRWWQRLAIVLQLQHREDGTLVWRTVLESGPRRIGKSVRLRAMALWRLALGPVLFEPEQLIVHTGKDLAIVREVLRKAWPWAEAHEEWATKRGMTEPEVSYQETNRWVARSKDSTTGYDCCLALVDEAWDVPPAAIDDDLEPSMLERQSPQLLLTSTAHRRATSLMRGRIMESLVEEDGRTMVLVWGAPPGSDPGDPEVWRAASPHWSEDRRQMVEAKYRKALAGEVDPEADDLDPMQGFLAQYLNVWRLRDRKVDRGDPLVTSEAWAELEAEAPFATPDAAAIESWFADGVSLALAWRSEAGPPVASVSNHEDLAAAVAALRESGFRGRVTVGASLLDDPALKGIRTRTGEKRTAAAVQALDRLLSEDAIRHDGGEHLSDQVLAVRTAKSADGARVVSSGRADAVKAAVWAVEAVRGSVGRPRIVTAATR